MTNYMLTFQIDPNDLATIQQARQKIVLARRLFDAGNVTAWASLEPAPMRTLAWNDDFGLFASNTPNEVGNALAIMADRQATLRSKYDFQDYAFSAPSPDPGLPANAVLIRNGVGSDRQPSIVFGLSQAYAVDGGSSSPSLPLNAQTVPALQSTRLATAQDVWVYLVSGVDTGTIIPVPATASQSNDRSVFSQAILVAMATQPSRTLRYSSAIGGFYSCDATPG